MHVCFKQHTYCTLKRPITSYCSIFKTKISISQWKLNINRLDTTGMRGNPDKEYEYGYFVEEVQQWIFAKCCFGSTPDEQVWLQFEDGHCRTVQNAANYGLN